MIKKNIIMKKILFLLAVLPMVLLSACSDDEEDKNSLVGTEWITKFSNDMYIIIKFKSDYMVEAYFTDDNFVMEGSTYFGLYEVDGNKVTFKDFNVAYFNIAMYKYESALILSSTMEVDYYWKYNSSSEWGSKSKTTFSKR